MDETTNGNGTGGQNRRYKLAGIWAALVTISYYICLFGGHDFQWWQEYAKQMTWGFAAVVGALSTTDIAYHVKSIFGGAK